MNVAALVLAAGSSRRLGQPKQLLEYKGRRLLDVSLDVARSAPFDQLLATVGGAGPEVRDTIDFSGFDVVESVHHTQGCSSSIVSALGQIDSDADGFILLLGDQPEIDPATITELLDAVSGEVPAPIGVCRYDDGIGHPFWFGRATFADLADLHGDKAVWKLIESGRYPVTKVAIEGPTPLDVDTWEEYEALLAQNNDEANL